MDHDRKKRMHMAALAQHSANLFSSLIHDRHIISDNMKQVDFENDKVYTYKGYFARKDRQLYWIDAKVYGQLPIKVTETNRLKDGNNIVLEPVTPIPFKIEPEPCYDMRFMVDNIAPYDHSEPDYFTLAKIIAIMGIVGRINVCVSSESAFGKSSVFDVLHYLTDLCPVFKPRSIPGVLNHINGVGNMVFDETQRCKKEVRDIIEEFATVIGAGKQQYINGALKSKNTKALYDCRNQSITFLYNVVTNYRNPEKDFFDNIFVNNVAMDTRFLKLKMKGVLQEKFDKEFDIPAVAEENKMFYIRLHKSIMYLMDIKRKNMYQRKYAPESLVHLTGRRLETYNDILWGIDMYAENRSEFDKLVYALDTAIIEYREMVNILNGVDYETVEEEAVE